MGNQNLHRMFEAIIDAGDSAFKVNRLARDEQDFNSMYGGNGEIVRLRDVTEDFPISENSLRSALESANFGEAEIQAMVHLLTSGYANAVT